MVKAHSSKQTQNRNVYLKNQYTLGNLHNISLYLKHHKNTDFSEVINYIVRKDDYKALEIFLINGIKANYPKILNYFVAKGNYKAVNMLIKRDIDVNSIHNSMTPLHVAAKFGQFKTAQLLIQKEANINIEINDWTPINYACAEGKLKIALLLLMHGADPFSGLMSKGTSSYTFKHASKQIKDIIQTAILVEDIIRKDSKYKGDVNTNLDLKKYSESFIKIFEGRCWINIKYPGMKANEYNDIDVIRKRVEEYKSCFSEQEFKRIDDALVQLTEKIDILCLNVACTESNIISIMHDGVSDKPLSQFKKLQNAPQKTKEFYKANLQFVFPGNYLAYFLNDQDTLEKIIVDKALMAEIKSELDALGCFKLLPEGMSSGITNMIEKLSAHTDDGNSVDLVYNPVIGSDSDSDEVVISGGDNEELPV